MAHSDQSTLDKRDRHDDTAMSGTADPGACQRLHALTRHSPVQTTCPRPLREVDSGASRRARKAGSSTAIAASRTNSHVPRPSSPRRRGWQAVIAAASCSGAEAALGWFGEAATGRSTRSPEPRVRRGSPASVRNDGRPLGSVVRQPGSQCLDSALRACVVARRGSSADRKAALGHQRGTSRVRAVPLTAHGPVSEALRRPVAHITCGLRRPGCGLRRAVSASQVRCGKLTRPNLKCLSLGEHRSD
jgi:hypothetical protein